MTATVFSDTRRTHYIITGNTNDEFCSDSLRCTDILPMLAGRLRDEGFDAVVFFDRLRGLSAYDWRSACLIRDIAIPDNETSERLRLVEMKSLRPQFSARGGVGEMWERLIRIMKKRGVRCAFVFSNINALQNSFPDSALQALQELDSRSPEERSIAVYIFRDSDRGKLLDLGDRGSAAWYSFMNGTLAGIVSDSEARGESGVVTIGAPNAAEIRNLLMYLSHRPEPVSFDYSSLDGISALISGICGGRRMGLRDIRRVLERGGNGVKLTCDAVKTLFSCGRSVFDELDGLVGLENFKEFFHRARDGMTALGRSAPGSSAYIGGMDSCRLINARRPANIPDFAMNMCLVGPKGTGKTTAARLYGRLCYECGLLPSTRLCAVTGRDLISEYVGGTAEKTNHLILDSLGGTLFIDEAYTLAMSGHGEEAVGQLVNDLEVYKGQFAVVIAGYEDQMDRLFAVNEGLASRFPNVVRTEDFTADELRQVFDLGMRERGGGFIVGEDLKNVEEDLFATMYASRGSDFGNGRTVTELIDRMKARAAERVRRTGEPPELTLADIPEKFRNLIGKRLRDIDGVHAMIDGIIGLGGVKRFLTRLADDVSISGTANCPRNFCFVGPPGTGKSMIADRLAKMLCMLGVIGREHVERTDAARLTGKVRGEGSALTETVRRGRRGVIFIDEAYQLLETPGGRSVIEELVPLTDDPALREDTVFVLAGYEADIARLLEKNIGLSSRFPESTRIRFDGFTASELTAILERMASEKGLRTDEKYLRRSEAALARYLTTTPPDFGNGRFIRNTYLPGSRSALTRRLKERLSSDDDTRIVSAEERVTLTEYDLPDIMRGFAPPVGSDYDAICAVSPEKTLVGKKQVADYIASLDQTGYAAAGTLHFTLSARPGYGRKTAMMAVAAAYVRIGLLSGGRITYVSDSSFKGEYQGQTAPNVRRIVMNSLGGMLAVRNPSSMLSDGRGTDFGREALSELISMMSAHRRDISVVLLDDREGLSELYSAYPELAGLVARGITLEEPDAEEMLSVFRMSAEGRFRFDDETEQLLPEFFRGFVPDMGGRPEIWRGYNEIPYLVDAFGKCGKKLITRRDIPAEYRKWFGKTNAEDNMYLAEKRFVRRGEVLRSFSDVLLRLSGGGPGTIPGCFFFSGSPGTGKKTAARILAGMLKNAGMLGSSDVILRDGAELVAGESMQAAFTAAGRGMLYIGNAGELSKNGGAPLRALLRWYQRNEEARRVCIVFSDTGERGERLLGPGAALSEIVPPMGRVHFTDYTAEDLTALFDVMCARAYAYNALRTPHCLVPDAKLRGMTGHVMAALCAGRSSVGAGAVLEYIDGCLTMKLRRDGAAAGLTMPELCRMTSEDIPPEYERLVHESERFAKIRRDMIRTDSDETLISGGFARENLAAVAFIEVFRHGGRIMTATGTVVSPEGHVLTSAHVLTGDSYKIMLRRGEKAITYDARIAAPSVGWCDMGLLRIDDYSVMPGAFPTLPLRGPGEGIGQDEKIIIAGYPFGDSITGDRRELILSKISGNIVSIQRTGRGMARDDITERFMNPTGDPVLRVFTDTSGKSGNSGSPVISESDGRVIGVFSGTICSDREGIDFFSPIEYFWRNFTED